MLLWFVSEDREYEVLIDSQDDSQKREKPKR